MTRVKKRDTFNFRTLQTSDLDFKISILSHLYYFLQVKIRGQGSQNPKIKSIQKKIAKGKKKKDFTWKNDLYMLVSRESDNRKAQGIATSSRSPMRMVSTNLHSVVPSTKTVSLSLRMLKPKLVARTTWISG
jgi:hypothetical protein